MSLLLLFWPGEEGPPVTVVLGRHVRGRHRRRPLIPLLPEPIPLDTSAADERKREEEAAAAQAAMLAVARAIRRRREDEWLLGLEDAA